MNVLTAETVKQKKVHLRDESAVLRHSEPKLKSKQ